MREIIIKEVSDASNKLKRNFHHWNGLVIRLGIKTRALWYAAEILQEKVETNKSVKQVYEMLKFVGKQEILKEKPELKKYIKEK